MRTQNYSLLVALGLLAACATPEVREPLGSRVLDPASRDVSMGQVPTTDIGVDQLGAPEGANAPEQIAGLSTPDAITADQLRTYRDRCAPDANMPPPAGVNCDELRLMIKRRYRSDDEVNRALNVLDNLGRDSALLIDGRGPSAHPLPPEVLQGGAPADPRALQGEGAAPTDLPPGVTVVPGK